MSVSNKVTSSPQQQRISSDASVSCLLLGTPEPDPAKKVEGEGERRRGLPWVQSWPVTPQVVNEVVGMSEKSTDNKKETFLHPTS